MTDELFMKRAIELAKMAGSEVYPNPYVGAVIVFENQVIAEGYHEKYGDSHAEVNAVNQVENKDILRDCTIYVTLEPCSHFGKTPPCADLIIRHQFKRVVVGSIDPFSLVNGQGITRIKNAGIQVTEGVLKNDCDKLNKRFFTLHQKRRPYIVLKWAESKDGFVASKDQDFGERIKITGNQAHQLVHLQRSREHGILIGKNTALLDNPSLDVRLLSGNSPIRFVIDAKLELPDNLKIFKDGRPTFVFNLKSDRIEAPIHFVKMDIINPETICQKLYELRIVSLYIEGGTNTIQQFINTGLWDEAHRFIGEKFLEDGITAPQIDDSFIAVCQDNVGSDVLEQYLNNRFS